MGYGEGKVCEVMVLFNALKANFVKGTLFFAPPEHTQAFHFLLIRVTSKTTFAMTSRYVRLKEV